VKDFCQLEAVGVESGGNKLTVNNFKDLRKNFWQGFSFSRDLRDHYCPLHLKLKTPLQDDPTSRWMEQGSAGVSLLR
jgi:hypothetical protein